MPFDGIFLGEVAKELGGELIGCRVDKIHQPSKDELVFFMRSRGGMNKLLISCSANSPRLHLTLGASDNPLTPPMFCMLMRKHLVGAVLTGMEQAGLDRVLLLHFDATTEIGDKTRLMLCVEVMAKYSNVILVREDNTIVDSVKRVDFTQSTVRQILPGIPYELPRPQGKLDIRSESTQALIDKVVSDGHKLLSGSILANIDGISPLIARELAFRVYGDDVKANDLTELQITGLARQLDALREVVVNGGGKPVMLVENGGRPRDFSYTDILQYGGAVSTKSYASYSQLLDDYYRESDRVQRTKQRAADMLRLLSNAEARLTRKLAAQRDELKNSEDCERYRMWAELISANRYSLEKGSLYYDLENYYDNNAVVRILADPALSPSDNSQKYFKEYRKAKTAAKMLVGLIDDGEKELAYIESVSDELYRAETAAELDEIRAELESGGYLKRRGRKNQKSPKPLPPIEYRTSDGFRVEVGRNNVQNDRLTLKTAGGDMWLHTQKIHGSHVIIFAEGRKITDAAITEAAAIAAWHSHARDSSNVPVDYTPVRNVKKPSGALPGKVIYNTYNTLYVSPAIPREDAD